MARNNKNRVEMIFARVTPAEKQAMEVAARKASMAISQWVRIVLLQKLGLTEGV